MMAVVVSFFLHTGMFRYHYHTASSIAIVTCNVSSIIDLDGPLTQHGANSKFLNRMTRVDMAREGPNFKLCGDILQQHSFLCLLNEV